MKRLLTLLLLVCGMTTGLRAQTAQLTRDGYLVKTFTGASSLSSAISAAANKGDIIILSSGNFSNPGNITKSVSIYGQGFENSTAIGNARTYIAGKIEFKLMSEGALDGIHLEGLFIEDDLNINTNIGTTAIVDDFTVTKCHSGGVFFYLRSTNVKLQNCKFDRDVRTYPGSYTTTMQVDNCYIEGNLFNFADGSNVIVNNSLIYNNWLQNYSAATSFNNCIIYKNILNGSSATKCIFNQSSVSGSTDNCWMGVNNGDIYVAEGEDGSYSESKSFAVKDTYVGTDNTPVGLQGGIGWNKTPTIPSYLTPEDLPQDDEGYYLLDGKMAWLVFAALVNGGTYDANAKMTADIDLGDDQTMVGTDSKKYKGTFDGQSHSLTIHYVTTNEVTAPFRYIDGATIKNLHVKGSINATQKHVGGFVANAYNGTCNIINCWSSIDLICNGNSSTGGFVGYAGGGTVILNIEDSYFDGSFTVVNALYCGGVVGRKFLNNSVKIYIRNCLFNPNSVSVSYTNNDCNQPETFCSNESVSYIATISNCYYTVRLGNSTQGTIASTEHLSDGTVAYKLQADRTDMFWGQRIGIDTKPVQTNDASYRVYRSKNGGYTNDPTLAYKGLQQDADDNYYLIGSLFDWQEFADLVKTTPTANAKMTADINLGDDQTMIGSESTPYQGTFDGQGHKLTVVYSEPSSSSQHVAPFIKIKNATIQNLHVSGSITTAGMRPASITSYVSGTCYVRNCWSDVAITSSYNADICAGGLVTRIDASQTLNMDDCKFSGSITLSNNSGYRAGGLIGWTQDKGIANVTNCLFAPSALSTIKSSADNKMLVSGYQGKVTITNCYYNTVGASSNWVVQGTAATDAELSNGTTTTALNNGRSEVIWVQDPVANQPMLAIFPAVMLGDVNGDHNIDENDLDVIVKIVMGETPPGIQKQAGDLNNDGKVDAADVVKMVDILNSRQDGGHPQ